MIDQHDPQPPHGGADPTRVGEARITRRIDHERDILVSSGDFNHIITAYEEHIRRWEYAVDPLGMTLMRQGLGAAALYLANRPGGELVGWTINIKKPPTNVFLTGDSETCAVTGRVFTDHVRTTEQSRMFVQSTRAGAAVVQSTIEVQGLDILLMFEEFHRNSDQTCARYFEINDDQYLMLMGLPHVDSSWLEHLGREAALEIGAEDLKILDTLTYRFQCGCNPKRMQEVVRNTYEDDPGQLFGADPGVEVLCPRCGRRWWIGRNELEVGESETTQGDPEDDEGPDPIAER